MKIGKIGRDPAALNISCIMCVRGGRMLFSGFDLALAAGQAAVLRGPNGIGKSSLIRVVAGLLPAFAGTIAHAGAMALCDDRLALESDLPLARALAFWAGIDGTGSAAVTDALAALDLTSLADIPVRMLSTGQRKRAMLARTAASGADIWLLDEPANGLDSASLGKLEALMAAHQARGGIILAASHQPLPIAGARDIDLSAWRAEAA